MHVIKTVFSARQLRAVVDEHEKTEESANMKEWEEFFDKGIES